MKSAGERSDRSSDPIKNAINAMIRTVDSGYVVGIRTMFIAWVAVPASVFGSPPGSFGTLADDRREDETDGAAETGSFAGDEAHRERGLGYAFRNPNNPPPDGADGTVSVIAPFSGASYNICSLEKQCIFGRELTTGDPFSVSSAFGTFSSDAFGSSLISMAGMIASLSIKSSARDSGTLSSSGNESPSSADLITCVSTHHRNFRTLTDLCSTDIRETRSS